MSDNGLLVLERSDRRMAIIHNVESISEVFGLLYLPYIYKKATERRYVVVVLFANNIYILYLKFLL